MVFIGFLFMFVFSLFSSICDHNLNAKIYVRDESMFFFFLFIFSSATQVGITSGRKLLRNSEKQISSTNIENFSSPLGFCLCVHAKVLKNDKTTFYSVVV